jgi:hypothetical protein
MQASPSERPMRALRSISSVASLPTPLRISMRRALSASERAETSALVPKIAWQAWFTASNPGIPSVGSMAAGTARLGEASRAWPAS